ncbi:ATP-binding cassette domain-containing protein [Streptomyces sp. SCSIO 30461]|uniref:ATP-binding cassette domain-containing protein n=1 Tax=Streptomyces sp. SCSIO 30461 TaxID=3118085 RepID=UPI0030D0AB7B
METHGAAVTAENFGLKGPRGWAFRGVGIKAEPGSLIAVEGPSASGRTCLLLALTGRMKPSEGHAEVAGLRLPRKMATVRQVTALGPVQGVSELDPALTVAEHLRERAMLQRRYDGSLRALLRPRGERRAAALARVEEALRTAGLDVEMLPKGNRTSVRDLERLEALRLSIALAMTGRPRLLAVDDIDLKLSDAERAEAWDLLRGIAAQGTTVLVACSQAPDGVVLISTGTQPAEATGTTAADTADTTAPIAPATGKHEVRQGRETRAEGADGTGTDSGSTDASEGSEHAEHASDTREIKDTEDTEEGADDALAETGRA